MKEMRINAKDARMMMARFEERGECGEDTDELIFCQSETFPDGVTATLVVRDSPAGVYAEVVWEKDGEEIAASERDYSGFLGEWDYEGDDEHPDYSVKVIAEGVN